MDIRNEECDAITELFEASMKGCVTTLNTLIEKHPLILDKISLTSFGETPLHISALLGHLDFTKALLDRKPKLALELDSLKRSPLHLASAEGHTEIVKALLHANKEANFVRDQDGRIPLHYAAMRGRVDVVRELISTRIDSTGVVVLELDGGGSSVLHLCVKYNHLEVLKLLVDQSVSDDQNFLNLKDGESGNTILHLAVMLRQIESIKYLLSIPKIKARADVVNRKDLTALEILEHCPKDFKSFRIRNILLDDDAEREQTQNKLLQPSSLLWCKKIIIWFDNLKYQGNWVEDMRGALMVVASMITTMTFQPSIAPPGGVWGHECIDINSGTYSECEAGTSVLAYTSPYYYQFTIFNTIAFIASLSVIFLLISGFPLKNKVFMWFLTLSMFTSLTFAALAYVYSMLMVSPYSYNYSGSDTVRGTTFSWIGLLAVVLGMHSIRLLVLLVKKRQWIRLISLKARTRSTNRDEPITGIELDGIQTASSVM